MGFVPHGWCCTVNLSLYIYMFVSLFIEKKLMCIRVGFVCMYVYIYICVCVYLLCKINYSVYHSCDGMVVDVASGAILVWAFSVGRC